MSKKFEDEFMRPFLEAKADGAAVGRHRAGGGKSPEEFRKDLLHLIDANMPTAMQNSDMAATIVMELVGHLGATLAFVYPDAAVRREVIEVCQRKVAEVAAHFAGETMEATGRVTH